MLNLCSMPKQYHILSADVRAICAAYYRGLPRPEVRGLRRSAGQADGGAPIGGGFSLDVCLPGSGSAIMDRWQRPCLHLGNELFATANREDRSWQSPWEAQHRISC